MEHETSECCETILRYCTPLQPQLLRLMGRCVEMRREAMLPIVCRQCIFVADELDEKGGTPLHTLVTLAEEEEDP